MTNTIRPWLSTQQWVSVRWGSDVLRTLCQQTRATLKPSLHLIFGSRVTGREEPELWCSLKSSSRVLFSRFFPGRCEELWGSIPVQAPIPHHKTFLLMFLWCFKRQMEYKGHADFFFFLSHFWKWRLWGWEVWFLRSFDLLVSIQDWNHLQNFKTIQRQSIVYCLENKWWV